MPSPGTPPAVEVLGLRKQYGGIVALDGMDLSVARGTIHAVVGENGAGKSTLMKALAGAVVPDAGEIRIDGRTVELPTPLAAREHGIGIVYQELSLFPERSVLANLFVDQLPTRRGIVDGRAMRRAAAPVLARIGLRIDPATPVGLLGIGERQLVELSRLLIERPAVLILDEPNSALDERETARLFAILRELSADGITILYVSHRLEEVFAIADHVTVVRNGRAVLDRERAALTIPAVVRAMIGSAQETLFPPRAPVAAADPGLEISDIRVPGELAGVSLTAHRGEIVGLAGLEGSGVSTLLGVLFGTRSAESGAIRFPDGRGAPRSPTDAARRRVSLLPADRRTHGLMLEASVARNLAHVSVGALRSVTPWLRRRDLLGPARRQIAALQIRADSPAMPVGQLSGGNQQKVVLGKWLEIAPEVMLLDDPTRGVDVGAKREIYALVRRLAGEGRVVLFRSTELPELVGLADRIVVFHRGRVAGEVRGGEIDDHGLLHAINTGELPDNVRPAAASTPPDASGMLSTST
ncbi:MAG TPA: sugar ABC transporter ATP-binding protein [Candidatus Limnocylindrales bacterium]|nr:sugar ABC transporter ATP-binding protein [Candidatus Limnocylindrales bacterium]